MAYAEQAPDSARPAEGSARPAEGSARAGSGRIRALDGFRALAAIIVLVFHVSMETGVALQDGIVGALLSRGDIGVPLFFALSGFLLYRPWAESSLSGDPAPNPRRYLTRRVLRIFPGYWVVMVFALVMWSREHLDEAWTWIEMVFLLHNYDPSPWWLDSAPRGLYQTWSIGVEVAFFLTLPLVAVAMRAVARRGGDLAARARRLLAGIAVIAGSSYVWTVIEFEPTYRGYLHMWLPRCWTYFAVGMALAVIAAWARLEPSPAAWPQRCCRWVAESWARCWIVAAVLYTIASTPLTGPRALRFTGMGDALGEQLLYTAVTACLIAPVALLPARPTPPDRLLGNRVMSYLGRVSYGIFLWQFVAIHTWYAFTDQRPWTGHFWFNLAGISALTLILGVISYHYVEEPARRLYRYVHPER
jgi:peptidoglycan/LPS O-acetylase OafA/YrhL